VALRDYPAAPERDAHGGGVVTAALSRIIVLPQPDPKGRRERPLPAKSTHR
jgi:hypothetical protein